MSSDSGAQLVFFALAMIYLVLVVFAIVRIRKLSLFSSEWRHAKIFYFLIILQAALRAVLFLILCFDMGSRDNILVFALITIPDSIFIVTYFMMFWQLLSVFYYAHFEYQLRRSFLAGISKRPKESWVSLFFLVAILVWLVLQAALYFTMFITNGESISSYNIWAEVGSMNLLLPTIVLLSMLTLQIVYSGRPLRDSTWRRKLRKMNVCTAVWSLGRYFDGVMSICTFDLTNSISYMVDGGSDEGITGTVLLIIYLIVCEGICLFLVLDYSFMEIFMISQADQEPSEHVIDDRSRQQELDSLEEQKEYSLDSPSSRFPLLATTAEVSLSELVFSESVQGRKNGLGTLFQGEYRGHTVLCRKIELPRMSKYVVEELSEEVDSLKRLQLPSMVPYYGVAVDGLVVTIVTPWFKPGSLYKMLQGGEELTMRRRLGVLIQVARCMGALHAVGRSHGHLNSQNVLIEEGGGAYVSDVGLLKFKKYVGIVMNYSNKTAWTSPELLSEKGSTPVKPQPSDDIYSFGVILWEILTNQEPFPGQTRNQLITQVVENGLRPEIPANVPMQLSQLMKSCWNRDPTTRPSFTLIQQALESAAQTIS